MKALVIALSVLAVAAALPVAEAGPLDCYAVYDEWEVGPVKIVQRSSCSYDVCFQGRCGILQ